MQKSLKAVNIQVVKCIACPRLVKWRKQVAKDKRAAFKDETYWGKPVPGFGNADAKILIMGLAPAAHGANRTGRMFTGDRSGDWLYAALYRAKLANQVESTSRNDGMKLNGVYITAPVKCAPPANKPEPKEKANCHKFIKTELQLLPNIKVFVALGAYAYQALTELLELAPRPKFVPKFSHGLEVKLETGQTILCSYHCSQQNTFTGKLTRPMFDKVIRRAKSISGIF